MDLYPLLCFSELNGWYHIENDEGKPIGEILVSVAPSKPLTTLNKSIREERASPVRKSTTSSKNTTDDPFFSFLQTSYQSVPTSKPTKLEENDYQKEIKTLKKLRQDLEQLNKQMKKS